MWSLPEWNAETHGTSLVVVVGGEVVHEWYADGLGPRTLFLGASMTKSVLTMLVGMAARAGRLSPDSPVDELVPALRGTGYAGCTLRDVLTMTTGVDWVEDHRDPESKASRLLMAFGAATGDSRALLTEVGPGVPPGTRFAYNTADSQVLDWARESATGTGFPDALEALWTALGCEVDAFVALDAPDGVAMAGGGVAACTRDWARAALLLREGSALRRAGRRPGVGSGGLGPVPAVPRARPAAQQHDQPCRVRLGVVAAGRRGETRHRGRQPRAVRLPRPRPRTSWSSRPATGPTTTGSSTASCAT